MSAATFQPHAAIDISDIGVTSMRQLSGHLEYCISFRLGTRIWSVWRRYRQFDACLRALRKHKIITLPLPPKYRVVPTRHGTSARTADARATALCAWIAAQLRVPGSLSVPAMLDLVGYYEPSIEQQPPLQTPLLQPPPLQPPPLPPQAPRRAQPQAHEHEPHLRASGEEDAPQLLGRAQRAEEKLQRLQAQLAAATAQLAVANTRPVAEADEIVLPTPATSPGSDADASIAELSIADEEALGTRTTATGERYAAFLSHYKEEAAMEARYLKQQLEGAMERRIFLDSDDLNDLRLLKQAVVHSDVLILIQTAHVLERPYCLIELATAIEHRVPIVGVSLTSGPFPYRFTEAASFLKALDSELDICNPGALQLLIANKLEPLDVAWQLSCTLPEIISIGFDRSASQNMLGASISDIVEAAEKAQPLSVPPKDEWLLQRAAADGPEHHHHRHGTGSTSVGLEAVSSQPAAVLAITVRAIIPPEVPELPPALQVRPSLLSALKHKVLGNNENRGTTAVVAARSTSTATTAAHGMGGVGKTTAAAQLVRDPEIGVAFERLMWVSVSAEPDVVQLLGRMHFQLKSSKLPPSVETELEAAQLLREAAKGVKVLLVLDDVWDAKHAELLNVVDVDAGATCVITTRIRSLSTCEVSCGLLSVEESTALLLTSGGLTDLVGTPPAAALEAVECCGRLALAITLAGGMIREMADQWETELVPLLKEELASGQISIEERVVNASLHCIEASQRAGVEALFTVFGCFAEDEVVPVVVLDVLAPLICEHAIAGGSADANGFLSVRTWLQHLLKASLLSGSVVEGLRVHDLVRDVMIAHAEISVEGCGYWDAFAVGGGLVRLQREVLRLLVKAFDTDNKETTNAGSIKGYVERSVRHHVASAQLVGSLHEDELLMSVLSHDASILRIRAVVGIGLSRMRAEVDTCEAGGRWWEAAVLSFAAGTLLGTQGGGDFMRTRAALRQIKPATMASMLLEMRTLNLILLNSSTATPRWGSAEHAELTARLLLLSEQVAEDDAGGCQIPDAQKFDAAYGAASALFLQSCHVYGMFGGRDLASSPEERNASVFNLMIQHEATHRRAVQLAPNLIRRALADYLACHGLAILSQIHTFPQFEPEAFCGPGGSWLRANIESYDFSMMHLTQKTSAHGTDFWLTGQHEPALLLFFGDLDGAKAGWRKTIDAWREVGAMVREGTRTWSEYIIENTNAVLHHGGAMLAAGETALLRQFLKHSLSGISLQDPVVAAEYELAIGPSAPFHWELADGRCFNRNTSVFLQERALNALVNEDTRDDTETLREWLPSPEALHDIATRDFFLCCGTAGAAHPTLSCALLYATRLGEWSVAQVICERFLTIPAHEMDPLARIEAWRLLARCHSERGDAAGAVAPLDRAVREAQAARYVWMEALALKEKHAAIARAASAIIPPEVPELPPALQVRPSLLSALKHKVLGNNENRGTTAVVAARSTSTATTAAHGMGGVGKTTAAAQLVRDPEIGVAFERLMWVSVSAEPDVVQLLGRMHFQLKSSKLPPSVETELEAAQLLREAAKGVKVLLVLDDVWDAKHAELLNVVDVDAGATCVITTRIRSLSTCEVSCGLLSVEESTALLLTSGGLTDLVGTPPAAALEAVECCGRLALAITLAGGMIREMADQWETELVPLLKEELASGQISIEERVVNASLHCIEASQRAGVEALFTVFGCFAEDEVVPVVVLDVLAPLICERALPASSDGPNEVTDALAFKRQQLIVRKWLRLLLNASILMGSVGRGASVHDLVRDVMMKRAEASPGGIVGLQRAVLKLFLAAYEDCGDTGSTQMIASQSTKNFILRSIKHHVAHSQELSLPLLEDSLRMTVLTSSLNALCARAVAGIGVENIKSTIAECEARELWWEAAQLWHATATARGVRAGLEHRQTLAAISHVQPETAASRTLEALVIHALMWVLEGGYPWGSPENVQLGERAEAMAQPFLEHGEQLPIAEIGSNEYEQRTPDKEKFYSLLGAAGCHLMIANSLVGFNFFTPMTKKSVAQAHQEYIIFSTRHRLLMRLAPDLPQYDNSANSTVFPVHYRGSNWVPAHIRPLRC